MPAFLIDDNARSASIVEQGNLQGSDSKDNAQAQVTLSSLAGKCVYLSMLNVNFSEAPTAAKAVTVSDGTLTYTFYIRGGTLDLDFVSGLKFSAGANVTITLAASGTAGIYGNIVATGLLK